MKINQLDFSPQIGSMRKMSAAPLRLAVLISSLALAACDYQAKNEEDLVENKDLKTNEVLIAQAKRDLNSTQQLLKDTYSQRTCLRAEEINPGSQQQCGNIIFPRKLLPNEIEILYPDSSGSRSDLK